MLLQELEDFGRAVSSKEELSTFSRRDEDVNILVNLALRLINKGYVPSRFHELHLYYALLILEELGDDLLRYGRPRADIEAEITSRFSNAPPQDPATLAGSGL